MSSVPSLSSVRWNDLTHPVVAGLVSVIVNYGGTFILVFQAAKVAGLSSELTASWVWSISIGVGVTGIILSWMSREPIITAWSTPAAAFLVTALATTPYAEAVGAYLISAAAFVVLGLSGWFECVIRLIPQGVAAGLLAGILLQFGIGAFGGMSIDPLLAGLLILAYLVFKRCSARYAVVGILVLGLAFLLIQDRVDLSGLQLKFAAPLFTVPAFSLNTLLSVALPLFLVTLTGQYMPGMLVLRNDGFKTSANPIVTVTGLGSLLMAPFGSHAFNLAAITAAIATGREAHEAPSKRWIAGIAAGACYILVGVFGVTLAAVFMALPATFISTLAGLALLGSIGGSLATALADAKTREASLITFLAAAANITLLGIGGAFWGLVIGLIAYAVLNGRLPQKASPPRHCAHSAQQGNELMSTTFRTQTGHGQHGHYPEATTIEDFRLNLLAVQARIEAACRRAGRDTVSVRLLPVSKAKPEASLRLAHAAGCRMLGENKPQEAFGKWEAMQDLSNLHWSVIGHLQTNKAKLVARFAAEFQALDSLRLAEALDRRLQVEGRSLDVFVQVNTSGEASKYGLAPDDVPAFIQALPAFTALRVRGLMTLALFSSEAERVRQCFVRLRSLRDRLRQSAPSGIAPDELSMGMSGDFEIAIEEGATVVRVGQAIFGARPLPDSHYWPG